MLNRVRTMAGRLAIVVFVAGAIASRASAQQSGAPLVGSWRLVAVDNVLADGSRVHLYGDQPQGMLTFDAKGHYTLAIMRAVRPKFAANDRLKGTAAENQATVQGSIAHFGTYSAKGSGSSPADQITFHVETATYPNWEGRDLVCPFGIRGDRLTYTVPTPSTGGPTTHGEVEWKRVD